jgi:hypothetical protein
MNYNPDNFNVELKAIKISGGEETTRFEAKLYINKKFAATVSNEGTGGCHYWYWQNRELEDLFNQHIKYLDQQGKFEFDFEQCDELIDQMIADHEEEKRLKKWCKTKTVCTTYDLAKGEYRVFDIPYSSELKTRLRAKFGNNLKEIVNERFLNKK